MRGWSSANATTSDGTAVVDVRGDTVVTGTGQVRPRWPRTSIVEGIEQVLRYHAQRLGVSVPG